MVGYLLYQELERNKELPDGKTWQLIYDVWRKAVLVNPGSTSLPKGGNPPTFGLYESASGTSPAKFSIHRLNDGCELASQTIG